TFSEGSLGVRGGPEIKMYRVLEQIITLEDVRAYGIQNMYRDITSDDCMQFEKLLGKLESSAATFVQTVLSGQEISLARTKLADLKKFLVIMMYRNESRKYVPQIQYPQ
ncbi:hypothetical protein BGZ51_009276, partial [Haplosporangium sp. Z 767]